MAMLKLKSEFLECQIMSTASKGQYLIKICDKSVHLTKETLPLLDNFGR